MKLASLRSLPPLLCVCLALLVAGCKRNRDTEAPRVWDEDPLPEETEAAERLAPAWPPPERLTLADELLTVWLHEPEREATHLRLLLPSHAVKLDPAVLVTLGEGLTDALARRLGGRGVQVGLDHRPGRVELVLRGPRSATPSMLLELGQVLATGDPGDLLMRARARVQERVDMPRSEEIAVATLVEGLGRSELGSGRIEPARLAGLSRGELTAAWARLLDPRAAVLVAHAGMPSAAMATGLEGLGAAWQANGRGKAPASAIHRLRAPAPIAADGDQALLGEDRPPLQASVTEAYGGGVVALGRSVPTPTWRDRGRLRLAQRLLQEELDARLTLRGDHGFLVVLVPLSGTDADEEVEAVLAKLTALATARQPRQRLFAAAQLWLGARMVQASLDGEDWTELWSQALDLSVDDDGIDTALAREAHAMLTEEPEALQQWQSQWLDPVGGRGGWTWAVAGAPPAALRDLERLARIRRVD